VRPIPLALALSAHRVRFPKSVRLSCVPTLVKLFLAVSHIFHSQLQLQSRAVPSRTIPRYPSDDRKQPQSTPIHPRTPSQTSQTSPQGKCQDELTTALPYNPLFLPSKPPNPLCDPPLRTFTMLTDLVITRFDPCDLCVAITSSRKYPLDHLNDLRWSSHYDATMGLRALVPYPLPSHRQISETSPADPAEAPEFDGIKNWPIILAAACP